MKKLAVNLALLFGTLAVMLLAGEAVVRMMFKDQNVLFPRYHTDYRYGPYTLRGIRPNADFHHTSIDGEWRFVTNSRGFRNTRDIPYEKPAGTVRILALGDSHTQGYEVRQDATFAAVAERALKARMIAAESINAGVSGYSTAEALAFLENEGVRYKPDVVVLGFYANDFEDNLKAGLFALGDGGVLEARKMEYIPGVKIQNAIYSLAPVRWLSENSYFYSLFFNAVWEHFKALAAKAARASVATEHAASNREGVPQAEVALAEALVLRMQAFCAQHGIRLIVADIPRRPDTNRFASSIPEPMAARLKAAGVEMVESGALLGPYDGVAEMHVPHGHQHISEFTHMLIGVEVAQRIAKRLGATSAGPVAANAPKR